MVTDNAASLGDIVGHASGSKFSSFENGSSGQKGQIGIVVLRPQTARPPGWLRGKGHLYCEARALRARSP